MEKEYTCCFTGHRELIDTERKELELCLKLEIWARMEEGIQNFLCGGALGFDTLAAKVVLAMKKECPELTLSLFLPCKDQAKYWSKEAQKAYQEILSGADSYRYCADAYYRGCMAERNRSMVHESSVCICYLKKISGGTAYTVQYAKQRGLRVINLADQIGRKA